MRPWQHLLATCTRSLRSELASVHGVEWLWTCCTREQPQGPAAVQHCNFVAQGAPVGKTAHAPCALDALVPVRGMWRQGQAAVDAQGGDAQQQADLRSSPASCARGCGALQLGVHRQLARRAPACTIWSVSQA